MEKKSKYAGISAFKIGWKLLNTYEKEVITCNIMNELNIGSKSSFNKIRCYGIGKLRAKQDIAVVEKAFEEFGFTPEQIWDDMEEVNKIKKKK